jgi:hypothetical protein
VTRTNADNASTSVRFIASLLASRRWCPGHQHLAGARSGGHLGRHDAAIDAVQRALSCCRSESNTNTPNRTTITTNPSNFP